MRLFVAVVFAAALAAQTGVEPAALSALNWD
jgi:hypothetical protein